MSRVLERMKATQLPRMVERVAASGEDVFGVLQPARSGGCLQGRRLERVFGESNLVPASILERGAHVGKAVVLDAGRNLVGWGSGIMCPLPSS
jgi:hypothetical protein